MVMRSGRKNSVVVGTLVLVAGVAWFGHLLAAALLLVTMAIAAMARDPIARRAHVHREAREKRRRREHRELLLEQADACGPDLEHLTLLVDRIEHDAPHEARCYALEDMLDRYVEIAIARAAYMRQLVRAPMPVGGQPGKLVRDVRERAAIWRQRCTADVVRCDELLGETADLLRLYAERVTTPEIAHLFEDDVVGRQLATLSLECDCEN